MTSNAKLPRCPVCGADMRVSLDSDETYYIIATTFNTCSHQYEMTESEYRALCAAVEAGRTAKARIAELKARIDWVRERCHNIFAKRCHEGDEIDIELQGWARHPWNTYDPPKEAETARRNSEGVMPHDTRNGT